MQEDSKDAKERKKYRRQQGMLRMRKQKLEQYKDENFLTQKQRKRRKDNENVNDHWLLD